MRVGDVVKLHGKSGEWIILWEKETCAVFGHVAEPRTAVGYDTCIEENVRHVPTDDMAGLVKALGLPLAVRIRKDSLPVDYLERLSSEDLRTVLAHTAGWGIDERLQKQIERILDKRGEPRAEKPEVLTAEYVRGTCCFMGGERACSFLVAGPETITCAKCSHPEMMGIIQQRLLLETIVAKGDYCTGRAGEVALANIPR